MRTFFLMVILLAAALQPAFPQGAVVVGPLPPPLPIFPANNWWNTDISRVPVDPRSAAFIAFIGDSRGMHPDFGGDGYGIPYVTVPGSQPRVDVSFDYDDESDHGGYPIPEEAKTQPQWIEEGSDHHMLIVDRDQRILYELYALEWNGSQWHAGSGAIFPLDSNARRPEGWTSADAAGLAILPGLVRYDEVYGTDPIRHAFRVTLRATNGHVFPASHTAGSTPGALPMGARLRLKASVDLARFPAPLQRIFQAMKTYGLIVADNGTDLYVTGTNDARWDNDVLNPAFAAVHASDFEVVQLGWQPSRERHRTARH